MKAKEVRRKLGISIAATALVVTMGIQPMLAMADDTENAVVVASSSTVSSSSVSSSSDSSSPEAIVEDEEPEETKTGESDNDVTSSTSTSGDTGDTPSTDDPQPTDVPTAENPAGDSEDDLEVIEASDIDVPVNDADEAVSETEVGEEDNSDAENMPEKETAPVDMEAKDGKEDAVEIVEEDEEISIEIPDDDELGEDIEPGMEGMEEDYMIGSGSYAAPGITYDMLQFEAETNHRFIKVPKSYSFARKDIEILEDIPGHTTLKTAPVHEQDQEDVSDVEENSKNDAGEADDTVVESAREEDVQAKPRVVGRLSTGGVAYLLQEEANGWYYVESGDARGYVRKDDLYTDDEADLILDRLKTDKNEDELDLSGLEASCLISRVGNKSYAHTTTTTKDVLIDKHFGKAKSDEEISVLEEKDGDSREVGVLPKNGIFYVISDEHDGWVFVESGDVRGFVLSESVTFSTALQKKIEKEGEESYEVAKQKIAPKNNHAWFYTITSPIEGTTAQLAMGSQIVSFAAQFSGNPYIWGGTSPTNGADCSGFVQTIYRQFGVNLPRTAAEQSQVGTKIPVEEARPGDLIFYSDGNHVYHVVIYAGNSKTVEAHSSAQGIGSFKLNLNAACWASRVLPEGFAIPAGSNGMVITLPEGLGDIYTYMGWQKVTTKGTKQYALREDAGMAFDQEGFGRINGRYVIACTTTYGNVGDYIDFYLDDGQILPCVVGDIKSFHDKGCTAWGHQNGRNVVEFVVDQTSWYGSGHSNPGTASCHPEWKHMVRKAVNIGNYWDSKSGNEA